MLRDYIIKDPNNIDYYIMTNNNPENIYLTRNKRYLCEISHGMLFSNYYINIEDDKGDSVKVSLENLKLYFISKSEIRNSKIESLSL